jgi:peptide/nickel transport system substrate-binding protein
MGGTRETNMKRRTFMKLSGAAAATALAAPAIAQSARRNTLTLIPDSDLALFDPIASTAKTPNAHGYAVYDTLFGIDSQLRAKPQMVGGVETASDGLTWTLRLRPGLKFHDNEPVRARDCVASIQRWGKVDQYGQSLMAATNEIEAVNDTDIRFRLKRPFAHLPDALGHFNSVNCFIMPERVAATDPRKPITDTVGSGPFKYVAGERQVGGQVVYEKNKDYVPRDEPADYTSGGKRVYLDRAVWRIISDQATAASALQSGEVDWWVFPPSDLVPLMKADPGVAVAPLDDLGEIGFIRFNSLTPPFNNPELRRIVAAAVDQTEYMQVEYGQDGWKTCYAIFPCGLPGVEEVGKPLMGGKKDYDKLKAAAIAAGYKGEKVVILQPVNRPFYSATSEITAATLRKIGMNVDLQPMDYATLLQRRASKAPVEQGGWSIFPTGANGPTINDPAVTYVGRGNGLEGYVGWYSNPEVEKAVDEWLAASGEAESARLITKIQQLYFDSGPGSVPVGQGFPYTAYRRSIKGVIPAMNTLMWNIQRV